MKISNLRHHEYFFGITFMRYTHSQKVRNQNNLKVYESNWFLLDIQTWLWSPMTEGGESYF